MDNIKRYTRLATNLSETQSLKVKASIPIPKDIDYTRGYITRYFVRKLNNPNESIIEVDISQFDMIQSSSLYIGTKLKWRISGSESDVKYSNGVSVKLASEKIKNLKLYLPNLLQFHKP